MLHLATRIRNDPQREPRSIQPDSNLRQREPRSTQLDPDLPQREPRSRQLDSNLLQGRPARVIKTSSAFELSILHIV
jgi:hypothetical protein